MFTQIKTKFTQGLDFFVDHLYVPFLILMLLIESIRDDITGVLFYGFLLITFYLSEILIKLHQGDNQ